MALRRVRGSRNYQADDDGFRAIGQSAAVGAEMLSVAERIAGNAEAVGSGDYEARPASVTVGWQNERRRGAVVRESRQDWKDWRDAILVRVVASMTIRGGSDPNEMVTYTRRDGTTRQASRAQADAWMASRTRGD